MVTTIDEAIASIPDSVDWAIARGRLCSNEPPYACCLYAKGDPEAELVAIEGDDLVDVIERAVAQLDATDAPAQVVSGAGDA